MEVGIIILLLFVGFVTGIIASLIGAGGGIIMVPILIFIINIVPSQATIISSFTIIFISFSSSLKYFQLKRIDIKTALIFYAVCIPSSILGGITSENIDPQFFTIIFGVILLIYSIRGLAISFSTKENLILKDNDVEDKYKMNLKLKTQTRFNRQIGKRDQMKYEYNVKIRYEIIIILAGGFISGLFGIGGGIIFVPLLHYALGVPFLVSTSTSLFIIFLNSLTIVLSRLIYQYLNESLNVSLLFEYGVPLVISSIIGALLGASISKSIGKRKISLIFWVLAFFSSLRLIFNL